MVYSASELGPEDREFEPGPVRLHCVLWQNTELSQCLSPPRCINRTGKLLGNNLTNVGEVTCHPLGVDILLVTSYYRNQR